LRISGRDPFQIKIPTGTSAYGSDVLRITGKPFFSILTENSTVKLFLDAIAHNTEEAACFISKNCARSIDLIELKDTFDDGGFKYLFSMEEASSEKGNCRTNTVLLFNNKSNQKTILHLYMIREPDQFGQWKIFNVERE
jgi:hypothetical protein